MIIKTPLVLDEGKIVYPTGKSWWSGAHKYGIYLVGDYSGDLYDVEGNKLFNWEEFLEDSTSLGSKITVLAYRKRFKSEEKAMLDFLSIDNPSETTQNRLMSARLRQSFADLAAASFVDLAREDTIKDTHKVCELLEQVGLVNDSQLRAIEILETPPKPEEIPPVFVGGNHV